MKAVMPMEEVGNVVPSTITWREPVEVRQVRPVESRANRASVESPRVRGRETPAHGGHLSDGDMPAAVKELAPRTRIYSGSSPVHGYGALTSSSSSPNLAFRDQDQGDSFTETTQIIGIQARLQEKPVCVGVPVSEVAMMPSVNGGVSPGSPQISRQTIRSRARPRKADEPAPFLSVDNLPVDKVIVEGKQHSKSRVSSESRKLTNKKRPDALQNGTGRKTRSPPQSAYTPPIPRSPSRGQSRGTPSATPYNYNSFFTHKSSAFLAGPPNLWSMGNKYWPQHGTPNDRQKLAPLPQNLAAEALAPRPNTQVSQPFKHDVDAEMPVDRPVSPSQDMKERTIYALREVTRTLNRQQSPPQSRRGGRLLKGRLKPLHTFKLSGPAIDNCKGIQPEEIDHGPSESQMLQRKQELLSMLPPDIFQPRPMTEESIHRTSINSQLSVDREKDLEDSLGQTEGGTEDQIPRGLRGSQVLSGARMPPNSLASLSDDNVSYLQDALTSHIIIPETSEYKEATEEHQEDGSEAQEDRSRVHQIPEAYATSYESSSKIDLISQQVEDRFASGDAPTIVEKAEVEEEGSVKDEVKGTMSDYMNEGGAAMVLSDMVQRVTNSAKKSTVEDIDVDPKYDDVYFADTETRSGTPTSRTESSTLMRRRSSMDDLEMDQASCELTDMVSEDGLGEDGSVKHSGKESYVERGSLTSLSKAKATYQEDTMVNDDTECHTREDAMTPINEDHQTDALSNKNLDRNSSVYNIIDNWPSADQDDSVFTLNTCIDNGLVENVPNSTSDAKVEANSSSTKNSLADVASESKQNGVCEGEANNMRTGSIEDIGVAPNVQQNPTETVANVSSDDAKSDVKALTTESDTQVRANGVTDKTSYTCVELNQNRSSTPVSTGNLVDVIPTVHIEVTGPESEIASEDSMSEQDTYARQSTDIITEDEPYAESYATEMATVVNSTDDSKYVINTDECSGERTGLQEDENDNLATKEEDKEDAQGDASSSCHSNGFKKDDKDQDGSQGGQGGSHGNGGGSVNGNTGGSNTKIEGGNIQNDPPSGTDGSGTQQRLNETIVDTDTCDEGDDKNRQRNVASYSSIDKVDNGGDSCEDYEDDIPDIDEAVLFCGVCGLDEDMCICPHSTFHEKLGRSRGTRPTTKSASAAEDKKYRCSDVSDGSYVGGNDRRFESWKQDDEIDEESIQKHLVLEYQAMIERPRQKGFLSEELTSPRNGEGVHMLLQGTGVKCESRQSSAKRRPQSFSSEFEFRDDRTGHADDRLKSCDGIDGGIDQLDCSMVSGDPMGDSWCWSEMQGGVADHSEELSKQNTTLLNGEVNGHPDTLSSLDKVSLHHSSPEAHSLEVVAKSLCKPRQGKESRFPAAPLPAPLCFRVNAKPPPGYLYYFAYGADMNQTRMSSYIGREVDHRLWGVLFGFQLTFNKRGADLEAGGFPNIAFNPDSSVEGCVYLITPAELKMLDQHVGCPKAMFPVWMMNCAVPDELGVAQYCIPALTYVAQDKWTLNEDEKRQIESDYSIGQCLRGSDLLTPSYIQHISTLRVH